MNENPMPSIIAPSNFQLSEENQRYIDVLRGISIIRVVLGHLGLLWFFPPYSQYFGIFLPVLFFVSGAVSFYSFYRSKDVFEYVIKRLVLVLTPFYVFGLLVTLLEYFHPWSNRTPGSIQDHLRWFVIWPNTGRMFFPFGQVWFINALVVMIIVSIPLFVLAKRKPYALWIGIAAAGIFSCMNFAVPFYEKFIDNPVLRYMEYGGQVWQIITLFAAFCAGALHYRLYQNMRSSRCLLLAGAFLAIAAAILVLGGADINLNNHIKHRSVYYLLLSFFAIYALLAAKPLVVWILEKVSVLKFIVLFANKYAYAIFLLHTLVLYGVEFLLGWEKLGGRPVLAIARLAIVLGLTFILAKPLGDVSSFLATRIRSYLLSLRQRDRTQQAGTQTS